jgi:hypothetical protein
VTVLDEVPREEIPGQDIMQILWQLPAKGHKILIHSITPRQTVSR